MNIAWHSRGQRFDPAYLHQKRPEIVRFQVFFYQNQNKIGNFNFAGFLEKWNKSGMVFFLLEQASQLCPVWN